MASSNSNGLNARMIWWILGIFGALLLVAATVLFSKLDRLDARMGLAEISLTRMQEQMRQVDELTKMTRSEQVERTQRFGDLSNRISLMEQVLSTPRQRVGPSGRSLELP